MFIETITPLKTKENIQGKTTGKYRVITFRKITNQLYCRRYGKGAGLDHIRVFEDGGIFLPHFENLFHKALRHHQETIFMRRNYRFHP